MLHCYHHHHQAVAATSASSDLSLSESWSACGGTGGSSYIINSNKYVRALQQQQQQTTASSAEALERMIVRLASDNAVVIFSNTTCCMCHAVKSLLCGMGVNPTVYELDQLVDPTLAKHIERALSLILANYQHPPTTTAGVTPVPVVFIGGKLLGTVDRVMASHINGTLVPLLKQAGALWL